MKPLDLIRPWSRRRALRAGALPFLGLGLPQLLAADRAGPRGNQNSREKSCIFIFQYGGLSQLDSWDPKPDGPAEIRGPYRPIATSVPGFHVGELMPRLARLADRYLRDSVDEPPRAGARCREQDAPRRPVAARAHCAFVRCDRFQAEAVTRRSAVARLAPEVSGRLDAARVDLPDGRLPGHGPLPVAGRGRARRQPREPQLPGRCVRDGERRSRPTAPKVAWNGCNRSMRVRPGLVIRNA